MTELNEKQINLAVFEKVMGANRVKLEQDKCGLVYKDKVYPCFEGHAQFHDRELWEAHYAGPDFCHDFVWIFAAEAAAAQTGVLSNYLEALVKRVYPKWNTLLSSKDVVDFWYALGHASPQDRATAMAQAVAIQTHQDLERVVGVAIELALPLSQATGEARVAAEAPFLDFVRALRPQQADELLAVMYLGRGDHPTLEATLRAVAGSSVDLNALAHQMTGKAPLAKYLRDGLAKLKAR